jgi:hypothetical protein
MYGFDNLPAGRYAITGKDGQTVRFFKIDVPAGKWGNHRFVKELHANGGFGAESLEAHPINKDLARAIATYLAKDPMKHLTAFGHKLGRCGICGRALTDDESLAAGIGPVCAGRL